MNTTILHIRHAEVVNTKKVYYQKKPFPLTQKGVSDSTNLAYRLQSEGIQPDVMYYSPLKRAEQTARIVADVLQVSTVNPDERLSEIQYPALTGKHYVPLSRKLMAKFPGYYWEKPEEVAQRISDFMNHILYNHEGQVVSMVSHEDVLLFAMMWERGIDLNTILIASDVPDELRQKLCLKEAEAYITTLSSSGLVQEGRRITPDVGSQRREGIWGFIP